MYGSRTTFGREPPTTDHSAYFFADHGHAQRHVGPCNRVSVESRPAEDHYTTSERIPLKTSRDALENGNYFAHKHLLGRLSYGRRRRRGVVVAAVFVIRHRCYHQDGPTKRLLFQERFSRGRILCFCFDKSAYPGGREGRRTVFIFRRTQTGSNVNNNNKRTRCVVNCRGLCPVFRDKRKAPGRNGVESLVHESPFDRPPLNDRRRRSDDNSAGQRYEHSLFEFNCKCVRDETYDVYSKNKYNIFFFFKLANAN